MNRPIRMVAAVSLAVGLGAGFSLPAAALAANPDVNPDPVLAPSISMVFTPSSTSSATAVALVFTITNPNVNNSVAGVDPNTPTGTLTSVAFTDTLPSQMYVATPSGQAGDCSGSVTATAGSSSISWTDGSMSPSSSCHISVNVYANLFGYYTNTTGPVTATSVTGNTATAHLSVGFLPPTIAEHFGSSSIAVGGTTSLTFTVTNPNTAPNPGVTVVPAGTMPMDLNGGGFTDTLPAGLVVATPSGLTGTCGGGTITAVAGTSAVTLAGATLAASTNCTFAVNVLGVTAGTKSNGTGPVTSTEAGAGDPGSAGLVVGAPASVPPTSTGGGRSGSETPLLPFMLLVAGVAGLGMVLTLLRAREVRG